MPYSFVDPGKKSSYTLEDGTAPANGPQSGFSFVEPSKSPGAIVGTLQSIGQGATGNFADELSGGLGAGVVAAQSLLHGEAPNFDEMVKRYRSTRDFARQQHEAFQEEHPVVDALAQGAGAIGTGGTFGVGAKGVGIGARAVAQSLPRIAGTGAVAGATYGVGSSSATDLPGWLEDAGVGAVTGGVLGVAAPPVVRGAANLVRSTGEHLLNAFRTVKGADRRANAMVLQALSKDGYTVPQAVSRLAELGPDATLMDLGTPHIRAIAEGVASQPGKGGPMIEALAHRRQLGQSMRVADAIQTAFTPGDDRSFLAAFDDFNNEVKAAARPAYEIAGQVKLKPTKQFKNILEQADVQSAWVHAHKLASREGKVLPPLFRSVNGELTRTRKPPTFTEIDYIKRALDDQIEEAIDPMTGAINNDARTLIALKSRFLKAAESSMEDGGAAYRNARQMASDPMANKAALVRGMKFINEDTYSIAHFMNDPDVSDSAKQAFRIGAMNALHKKALSTPDFADAYKRIFGNEAMRTKISTVLQDKGSVDQLKKALTAERDKFKAQTDVLSNSVTARRTAAQQSVNQPAPNMLQMAKQGIDVMRDPVGSAANIASEQLTPKGPLAEESFRDLLSQRVLSQDPNQLLQQMPQATPSFPPIGNNQDPRIAALIAAMTQPLLPGNRAR